MLISLDRDSTYINPDYIINLSMLEHESKWLIVAVLINGKTATMREFTDFQEAEMFLNRFITEVNHISRRR